jgi:hypothetical protein
MRRLSINQLLYALQGPQLSVAFALIPPSLPRPARPALWSRSRKMDLHVVPGRAFAEAVLARDELNGCWAFLAFGAKPERLLVGDQTSELPS